MNNFKSVITLSKLELSLYLGWLAAERSKKQKVVVDIQLHFLQPPLACSTDNLQDTYCYDTLIKTIKKSISTREFHLIEHLAHEIYAVIKKELRNDLSILVSLTKKPAIKNLTGGVTFQYGDKF